MKKNFFTCGIAMLVCMAVISGLFGSCQIPHECADYRGWMDSIPYSETDYNSIKAITYRYLSNPIGKAGSMDENEVFICSEDSTIKDQEIKVFGLFFKDYGRNMMYEPNVNRGNLKVVQLDPSDCMSISFDTSDHAISEKLGLLNSDDTIYLKGRLRLYYTSCQLHEGYYNCVYLVPGIYIDNADDITIKQYENN